MKVKGIMTDWGNAFVNRDKTVQIDLVIKDKGVFNISDITAFNFMRVNKCHMISKVIFFTCDENKKNVKFSKYFMNKYK